MEGATGRRIGVIGGGAAGSAVVAELLARGARETEVFWFAGDARGRGIAYGTRRPEHTLNVRAALMGLLDTDAGDFVRFLEAHIGTVAPTAFVARSLFGDFIEATVERLRANPNAPALHVRDQRARSLTPLVTGWQIEADGEAPVAVAQTVLATGALPPRPLPQVAPSAVEGGRYLLDPWRLDKIDIEPPRRVLVIGSRLTAIDAVLTVSKRWPDAQITALSRHGRLPFTHTPEPLNPYPHQGQLIEEMEALSDIRQWIALLRATAQDDGVDPRALIDGLRGTTNRLWRLLDPTQRGRFLRHARWLWDAMRHRTPPQTANAIDHLRASGRLTVVAGRVRRVEGARPTLTYRRRSDGSEQSLTADLAVQATGFESTLDGVDDPLLSQLIAHGILQPDQHGLGWRTDPDGRAISAGDDRPSGLWIIGGMLRATLWESASMPEIRAFAGALARRLLA